jgi:hypothetical protein
MKQLITRVPDDVLDACKRKAKAEGVSMNTFVNASWRPPPLTEGRGLDRRLARRHQVVYR